MNNSFDHLMLQAFEKPAHTLLAQIKQIETAIEQGSSINSDLASAPNHRHPPLKRACWQGSLGLVSYLLKSGAQVAHSQALLAWASCCDESDESLEILKLLLAYGADLNEIDADGHNSLSIASSYGDTLKIKWLQERGAKLPAGHHPAFNHTSHICFVES